MIDWLSRRATTPYHSNMESSPRLAPWIRDRGASLVGLLLALIILGIMAAVAVSAVGGTGGNTLPKSAQKTSPSVGQPNIATLQAALSATCVTDFTSISTAVQVYSTLHSSDPPAGTSWVTRVHSGTALLQSWPSDPGHFTFTWNGTTIIVVPRHGASSTGSAGSTESSSGCYAPLT